MMASLRFSRDKRGYESTYLVLPTARRGKSRPRVVYWFRTPPGIRVGREPFDEAMRGALESQYPDATFDWQQLANTPIPPPPAPEPWRERRRAEREAKLREKSEAAAEAAAPEVVEARADDAVAPEVSGADALLGVPPSTGEPRTSGASSQPSSRRRRRGRRRGRGAGTSSAPEAPEAGEPSPMATAEASPTTDESIE